MTTITRWTSIICSKSGHFDVRDCIKDCDSINQGVSPIPVERFVFLVSVENDLSIKLKLSFGCSFI